jgi:hypothetical protein
VGSDLTEHLGELVIDGGTGQSEPDRAALSWHHRLDSDREYDGVRDACEWFECERHLLWERHGVAGASVQLHVVVQLDLALPARSDDGPDGC